MPQSRVYIAGPYRADKPIQVENNILSAELRGMDLWRDSCGRLYPVVPHSMTSWDENREVPDEAHMEALIAVLETCNAIWFEKDTPYNLTPGQEQEYKAALAKAIPIYFGDKGRAELLELARNN